MRRFSRGISASLTALALLAALPALGQGAARNPGYRIGPKDLVAIQVFEVPELNVERRVTEDGKINLPLIGDLAASGLTENELAERLKTLLESKYVQRASTAVEVREFRSKPIAVIGAVHQPGNLAFSGRWTLIEAITAAGGLAESHGNVIYVLRRAENGLTDQVAIDANDLMVRADPRANLPIFANDLINVPATVEVTVYCLGEVGKPGALAFKSTDRITLLAAVARAGGLSDRASRKIMIKRAGKAGAAAPGQIGGQTVDYKRILAGKDPDVELREGDVVVVKESFF
jgi:polysaccharide export outer membrane protein